MKTWRVAGAFILGTVMVSGCAAAPSQGAQVRVHTTTAAFMQQVPAQGEQARRPKKAVRKESPLLRECKTGNSKSCNELGDRLTLKHAYGEARQWYMTSCKRVSEAMLPTATRFLQLSQELTQAASLRSDDQEAQALNQKRLANLKSEAWELRARIQGCLDTGETLRNDAELKQSLKYFDAVCEFSTVAEAMGEAMPGLEHVTNGGCAGGQSARAQLGGAQLTPQLFDDLLKQQANSANSADEGEQGMVFSGAEL